MRNIGILDIFESKKTKTGFAEGFTVWNERKNKVKCDFKVFNLSNWEDKPGGQNQEFCTGRVNFEMLTTRMDLLEEKLDYQV